MRISLTWTLTLCLGSLSACTGSQVVTSPSPKPSARTESPSPIIALVNNQPVRPEDLANALYELAGREALREEVLDRMLEARLAQRQITITPEMIRREHELFTARLAEATAQSSAEPVREQLWRSRHLGPTRREQLFRRNAALRALVSGQVEVTQPEVDLAVRLAYGPKKLARLILLQNERDAAEVRSMLGDRPSSADVVRLAERRSIDPTSVRGGLLPPIHVDDPEYPIAVRNALRSLEPGGLSAIIPLPEGAALIYLEGDQEGTPPPPEAADRLRRELLIQRERSAMDRLARTLVAEAKVSVLDRSLGWAWDE
ncbi:MAG: hypothetical protein Kow0022_11050 [Phycisphaerales bacterium]